MKKLILFSLMCLLSIAFVKADVTSPIWQTSSEGPIFSYDVEPGSPRNYYDNGGPDRNMRQNFALTIVQLKPALRNHHITVVFEEMDMGNDLLKFYNGAIELFNGPNEDGEYVYDWPKDIEPILTVKGNPEKLPLIISSTSPDGALTVGNLNLSSTKGWKAIVYCVKNGDPEPGGTVVEDKGNVEFGVLSDLGTDSDGEEIDECSINMTIGAGVDNAVVQIDWGNGEKKDYTILSKDKPSTITQSVDAGARVKIFGDLSFLDLSGNKTIESIEFNKKDNKTPAMQILRLSQNKISKIFLNDLTNLRELAVSDNNITEMNISHLEKLEEFYGAYNPYSELRTSTNPNLIVITCYNTGIKELDLSRNTKLKVLTAGGNNYNVIPSLDNNTALTALDFEKADLESIDLSKLINLKKVNLAYANLSTIDMSNNTHIQDINLAGNNFDPCTINDLLIGLPKALDDSYIIRLAKNPGISQSQTELATMNGWKIDSKGNGEGCANIKLKYLPSEHGHFITKIGDTEYKELQNIAKGMTVKVEAKPEKNYTLQKVIVNGKDVECSDIDKATFEAKEYAWIAAVFVKDTYIASVDKNAISIHKTVNGFEIAGLRANENYVVYDLNGRVVADGYANNEGVAHIDINMDFAVFKTVAFVVKLAK